MKNSVLIKNGRVFIDDHFSVADILVEQGIVKEVKAGITNTSNFDEYDATGLFVLPGFIDVHTHGAVGVDINHASREEYDRIARFFATEGCTSWLASIITDTKERTKWCIEQAVNSMSSNSQGATLLGIHLEGPFLNTSFKGAMPESLLREGEIKLLEEYINHSNNNIKYITVAPEVEGVLDLVKYAKAQGVVVAVGHSGATYEQTLESIELGVTASTHTFNAMKLFHQHEPAIMGAVLESEKVYCEAIFDGKHLHKGAVKLLLQTKGNKKIMAITDCVMATGLPDGEYNLGINKVILKNKDVTLKKEGTRAGSVLTMSQAFRNYLEFTKVPLEEAVRIFSLNPALMLKIDNEYGSIEPGKKGDIVCWSDDLQVMSTFINGHKAFSKN